MSPMSESNSPFSFANSKISEQLSEYGILGIMGLGTGIAVLTKSARIAAIFARERAFVSLELSNRDKSFFWFMQWFSNHYEKNIFKNKNMFCNKLTVQTVLKNHDQGAVEAHLNFQPGVGKHLFKYKNHWFQIERNRNEEVIDFANNQPFESVTVTTLSPQKFLFTDMISDAKLHVMKKEHNKTVVYMSKGPDWKPFGQPRRKRPLESVVLKQNQTQDILTDVQQFLKSQNWYHDRGIPYRRGYLLHGTPGTGKSSFIQALSGQLEYNICVVNLSERGLTDDRLAYLLVNAPSRSILLIEDVDAAFLERKASEEGFSSMVTFSGLLNALDGVIASEERLIFMTTNHLDRLDPALIRPGRVDKMIEMSNADNLQIQEMFKRFYTESSGNAQVFVGLLRKRYGDISPAHLQGLFIENKNNWKAIVDL
eukprot:NODE_273_length_12179_cov_0.492632.p4 type:complete len:425 gc:universal NODE_273_length_12179_cov_0.492632:11433-10159(-)